MAAKKGSSSSVVHKVSDAGDHAIGVKHEGVFIPFAGVPAHRFAQLLENAHDLAGAEPVDEEEEATE